MLGNSKKDPGRSTTVKTHQGIYWGQREGSWTFFYSQNSSRNMLGNSKKDPGRSTTVKTHQGIYWGQREGSWTFLYSQNSLRTCWGTTRMTLDFPLHSELIEESVFGKRKKNPGLSSRTRRGICWGARRSLEFPLQKCIIF
jgi:hypothetical protein